MGDIAPVEQLETWEGEENEGLNMLEEEVAFLEKDWNSNIPKELNNLSNLNKLQFTTGIVFTDYPQRTRDKMRYVITNNKGKFVLFFVLILGGILLFILILEMIVRATI